MNLVVLAGCWLVLSVATGRSAWSPGYYPDACTVHIEASAGRQRSGSTWKVRLRRRRQGKSRPLDRHHPRCAGGLGKSKGSSPVPLGSLPLGKVIQGSQGYLFGVQLPSRRFLITEMDGIFSPSHSVSSRCDVQKYDSRDLEPLLLDLLCYLELGSFGTQEDNSPPLR